MGFLKRVKNIEHHIRRANNIQDFATSPLSFTCTFNQPWKIKNLYFRSSVFHQPGYACQSRECKCASLRFDACKLRYQARFTDRRESNESNTCVSRFLYFKSRRATPGFSLSLLFTFFESSNLSLQLPDVPLSSLVVFRLGNLLFKSLNLLIDSCHGDNPWSRPRFFKTAHVWPRHTIKRFPFQADTDPRCT